MSVFNYVNHHYGVNACVGRRVIAYGEPGTIVRDFGNYIGIVLDSAPHAAPERYHPTDGIEYGDVIDYTRRKLTPGKPNQREIGRSILMPIMGIEILPTGWVSTLHVLTTIAVAGMAYVSVRELSGFKHLRRVVQNKESSKGQL